MIPDIKTSGSRLVGNAKMKIGDSSNNLDQQETQMHRIVIYRLADEFNLSVWEVAQLYESFLTPLQERAVVKNYLPILAAKKVKRFLRDRASQRFFPPV